MQRLEIAQLIDPTWKIKIKDENSFPNQVSEVKDNRVMVMMAFIFIYCFQIINHSKCYGSRQKMGNSDYEFNCHWWPWLRNRESNYLTQVASYLGLR